MNFWKKLFRRKKSPAASKSGLTCCDCGARIHKHELYTVLVVRHKNCLDTRGVGQMSLKEQAEESGQEQ